MLGFFGHDQAGTVEDLPTLRTCHVPMFEYEYSYKPYASILNALPALIYFARTTNAMPEMLDLRSITQAQSPALVTAHHSH